ncbi:EamA family transporter [Anaerovibrio sp.]|uniref:DMT family transporter n=1 Tax=Anaerovibrio sp. TaxID=1872532 RepID=UPI0025C5AF15|nr:EamA family transporter [Anaerovibrio sp.]MBR2142801.1 EamA family transporter [Anaerovibrio sp.]
MAITGSILWGIMGVTSQYLLQIKGLPALWVVTIRMFFAGIVLLLADYCIYKRDFFAPWRDKKTIVHMLIFSFVTIMWVQYAYLSAVEHMNAAMATVFVSLAPIATIVWMSLRSWCIPKFHELLCCISAVLGATVMATHGDMTTLSISQEGIIYGIMLPIAGVVYTVQPGYLMKNFRPSNVTGWGLLLGGTALLPITQPWHIPGAVDMDAFTIFNIVYTVLFGTAIAFWTFLASLKYIKPQIAAIYELVEPVSAIFLSVWLLEVMYQLPEFLGTVMILCPVLYLSLIKESHNIMRLLRKKL